MDSEWTTSGGNYEVEKDDSEAERYQKKDEGEKDEVEEARTREGHEDGKVKRETVGAQEGLGREEGEMEKKKKKEDSPGDLRYETLIKIISSASVGCQGAYTTASRECNDLNGNNSVKDGCSRAHVHRHGVLDVPPLSPCPSPLFVLHEQE